LCLARSFTFLSFFLPDDSRAGEVAEGLSQAGVDSCFYWYDNNWHYIRQWDHIKTLRSAAKLQVEMLESCPDYNRIELPESDAIIGRTISMLIKLSWTEEDLSQRIEKIASVLTK
jgi:8-amino-3,8-dideoxy-alpha-D-manno-octulosonate transaminase